MDEVAPGLPAIVEPEGRFAIDRIPEMAQDREAICSAEHVEDPVDLALDAGVGTEGLNRLFIQQLREAIDRHRTASAVLGRDEALAVDGTGADQRELLDSAIAAGLEQSH